MRPWKALRGRPRLLVSVAFGLLVAAVAPDLERTVTRVLVGWNAAVWLFIALDWWMMIRADHRRLRQIACAHAEGAAVVLATVTIAAVASMGAIFLELTSAKAAGAGHALSHVALAVSTVVASWLLLPTLFALNYASLYYVGDHEHGGGLN